MMDHFTASIKAFEKIQNKTFVRFFEKKSFNFFIPVIFMSFINNYYLIIYVRQWIFYNEKTHTAIRLFLNTNTNCNKNMCVCV